jgi:hypothetical protein
VVEIGANGNVGEGRLVDPCNPCAESLQAARHRIRGALVLPRCCGMAAASSVGAECHAMLPFLSDIDARWPARMKRESCRAPHLQHDHSLLRVDGPLHLPWVQGVDRAKEERGEGRR